MPDLATVLDLLDLEALEVNLFRGRSPQEDQQRVFGGQVAGQALVAAGRTSSGRSVHSLQAYFLRPGDPSIPILYQVDRIRDGRSFSTRRVTAVQHGRPIFALSASFQVPEQGIDRSVRIPDVPAPESVPTVQERLRERGSELPPEEIEWASRERSIEMRHLDPDEYITNADKEARNLVWIRASQPVPSDDPLLHQCLITYASDMTLIDTAMRPHLGTLATHETQIASLDHTMWFHRDCRADEWLLYVQESPTVSGSRGLTNAQLFRRSGELVVSVVQEGLIRVGASKGAA